MFYFYLYYHEIENHPLPFILISLPIRLLHRARLRAKDNWYLVNESSIIDSGTDTSGLAYYKNNSTAQLYVCDGQYDNSKISVYDLNGSLCPKYYDREFSETLPTT